MGKFLVTIEFKGTYDTIVEAQDEDEAKDEAYIDFDWRADDFDTNIWHVDVKEIEDEG